MKGIAVLPDADAVLGHRLFEAGREPADLPPFGSQKKLTDH
jgi:hypothetical protein